MTSAFRGKVVWITGGGSGIGEALVRGAAKRGARVAISGRRMAELTRVAETVRAAGGEAIAVPCDVRDEASLTQAVASVRDAFGGMDVCIANAGYSVRGKLAELTADEWRAQLDTNVVGAAMTIKHALPELTKTRGRLALVGSVAAFVGAPSTAAYCASKAALRAIGQVAAVELLASGVSCTLLHPGFVESEIARVDNTGVHDPSRTDRRPQRLMWPAEKAAEVMLDAIEARRLELVFTGHGRIAAFLGQHFPGVVHTTLRLATRRGR